MQRVVGRTSDRLVLLTASDRRGFLINTICAAALITALLALPATLIVESAWMLVLGLIALLARYTAGRGAPVVPAGSARANSQSRHQRWPTCAMF
jgi:hypothetical protein